MSFDFLDVHFAPAPKCPDLPAPHQAKPAVERVFADLPERLQHAD